MVELVLPPRSMRRIVLDGLRCVWKLRPLESVLVALTQGRPFGSLVTKLPPNHYQYARGTSRTAVRGGIRYSLDIADLVDWYIYYGFREAAREALYAEVRQGDTAFDVGANVGDVTLHIARLVGAAGSVHSFEPDPVNFRRLQTNASMNGFANVFLNQTGLGDTSGTFSLDTVDERNRGMNRIRNGGARGCVTVELVTLDQYVLERRVPTVDLVKIDVEGFELRVLKGAAGTLERCRPKLFIEMDERNLQQHDGSCREIVAFLESMGYLLVRAGSGETVTSEQDFADCHFDAIAAHETGAHARCVR